MEEENKLNSEPENSVPMQNYPPPPYSQGYPPYPMYLNYTMPPPPPPPPETPPAKPIPINQKTLLLCCIMAGMIFILCLYCMITDILHGALQSGDTAPAQVVLQTQKAPELDPKDENVTADGEYTVRGVAELVKPSIVEVYVYGEEGKAMPKGTGSGIIISEDGYIITNAHVVQGTDYSVTLDNEKEYTAQLIGSDNKTDLAVLKISASDLTPAVLGDSDETYVGQSVVAIGNPAGLFNTVTQGIVSAVNRQIRAENSGFKMECIQTDAAISPGNSGGALVNMYGQVIGITSSKYASQYEATYEGLGFAITVNQALPIVQELIENGYVSGRFRIGITFMATNNPYVQEQFQKDIGEELPDELKNCLWVSEVSKECDISHTDLKKNDFILEINGNPATDYDSVLKILDSAKGGDTVTAKCARLEKGKISYFDISFKLEEDTSGNY